MSERLFVYRQLLKLYPANYRQRYEREILQTAADMLDEAPGATARFAVRTQLVTDLPKNILKQRLSYAGGIMHNDTPNYIKKNGMIGAALLLPFFLALLLNGMDRLINGRTLYHSWLWRSPTIGVWVLLLPALAFLVAGASYATYIFSGKKSFIKRVLDVARSWPILLTTVLASGIVFGVTFHDSVQCWTKSPTHVASHLSQAWQCTEHNAVSAPKFF